MKLIHGALGGTFTNAQAWTISEGEDQDHGWVQRTAGDDGSGGLGWTGGMRRVGASKVNAEAYPAEPDDSEHGGSEHGSFEHGGDQRGDGPITTPECIRNEGKQRHVRFRR